MSGATVILAFVALAITALVIEAIRFDRRMAKCSRTEALRRLMLYKANPGGGKFERAQDGAQRKEGENVDDARQGEDAKRLE